MQITVQVGAMAHGKIETDYVDDLISGYSSMKLKFSGFEIKIHPYFCVCACWCAQVVQKE